MRGEMGKAAQSGIQWCPECGVPTVKSEGCNHIICVCGASWQWQKSSINAAAKSNNVDAFKDAMGGQPPCVKLKFTNNSCLVR